MGFFSSLNKKMEMKALQMQADSFVFGVLGTMSAHGTVVKDDIEKVIEKVKIMEVFSDLTADKIEDIIKKVSKKVINCVVKSDSISWTTSLGIIYDYKMSDDAWEMIKVLFQQRFDNIDGNSNEYENVLFSEEDEDLLNAVCEEFKFDESRISEIKKIADGAKLEAYKDIILSAASTMGNLESNSAEIMKLIKEGFFMKDYSDNIKSKLINECLEECKKTAVQTWNIKSFVIIRQLQFAKECFRDLIFLIISKNDIANESCTSADLRMYDAEFKELFKLELAQGELLHKLKDNPDVMTLCNSIFCLLTGDELKDNVLEEYLCEVLDIKLAER